MSGKIPQEAFDAYFGLGPGRSYQVIADRLGVTKRSVTKFAAKHQWQERVAEIEARARAATEQKAVESLEAMNDRHLKTLRAIQARALEVLKEKPLQTAMDAVRALGIAIREGRLIRGEPSIRTAHSVEEVIRREFSSWMMVKTEESGNGHRESADVQQGRLLP